MLLLRLHTETARRSGALALRPEGLDPERCLIQLHEKGGISRWQPVSPTLMSALRRHGHERGSAPGTPLLRFRNGTPLTRRRYDHLWNRLGKHIPAIMPHGISTHWLRYKAVARAFAGHTNSNGGATDIYTRAPVDEVAEAVAQLTGEPHPLASASGVDWTKANPIELQENNIGQ